MADTEPYKAEFEAWARVECNLPFYAAIDWNHAWTKQAWKIWQASALASRPAEVDDRHQQDLRDVLNLTWSAAVESAAFYVAGHCHDGDFHAETILELVKPKIRVRGVEILPSPAPSHTTKKHSI